MAHRTHRTRESKRRIVTAYLEGLSTQIEIAQAHRVNATTIKRWMLELGISKTSKGRVA